MRLAVIGAPWNSSGGTAGEAAAPAALRPAGLIAALRETASVADFGDVVFAPPKAQRDPATGIIGPHELAELTLATRAATSRALASGRFPLVVGGDCAFLLGCLAAARDAVGGAAGRIGLILVDGHEDAYPPHASPTGEVADMELGLALGRHLPDGLPALTGHLPVVAPGDVVILGARDASILNDDGVASLAGEIAVLDDAAVRSAGVAATVAVWTSRLAASPGRWWLHLDLDALSTDALPAVSYCQPGGFDWGEMAIIAGHALRHPACMGLSVADYNPDLDPLGEFATRVVEFLAIAMRDSRRIES